MSAAFAPHAGGAQPPFQPGLRFSFTDGLILLAGAAACAHFWRDQPAMSAVVALVVLHFFLFCNVVRLARGAELVWAAIAVVLGAATFHWQWLDWPFALAILLTATAALVGRELRQPRYHGVGWQRVNPGLADWFKARHP